MSQSNWLAVLSLTVAACGSPEVTANEDPLCFCASRPNMIARCVADGCVYSCSPGWLDCDTSRANGCETPNDINNCNTCGTQCLAGRNEVPVCTSSGCAMECVAGWANCNGLAGDGCETQLDTTSNCVYCGWHCGPNETCIAGQGCSGCGDGYCGKGENHTYCPEDCLCPTGTIDCCLDGTICRTSCYHVTCL